MYGAYNSDTLEDLIKQFTNYITPLHGMKNCFQAK